MTSALQVGMTLHAAYSLDGEFYQAVVTVISKSKKHSKAPVQVEFTGYATKEWKQLSELKSKNLQKTKTKAYDYSGLETGTRLQAMATDGKWYAADVAAVATSKKRAGAPVKVNFVGYTSASDEWLGGEKLRSKAVRVQGAEKQAQTQRALHRAESTGLATDLGKVARSVSRTSRQAMLEEILKKASAKDDSLSNKLLCEARLLASKINTKDNVYAFQSSGPKALRRERSSTDAAPCSPSSSPLQRVLSLSSSTSSVDEGKLPTKIIGVCGMSSSGKSTVTKTLQEAAEQHGLYVPVMCMDDSYGEFMFKDPDEAPKNQPTMSSPIGANGRRWKNWETPHCMDWEKFLDRLGVQMAIHFGYTPFIIIEGFLMLENQTIADITDVIISLDILKETAWQRRVGRAIENPAAGTKDDYEQLHVYAFKKDHDTICADANAHVEKIGKDQAFPQVCGNFTFKDGGKDLSKGAGTYSWLRLYFDEVIWPEAENVIQHVDDAERNMPKGTLHRIKAEISKDAVKEEVLKIIRGLEL